MQEEKVIMIEFDLFEVDIGFVDTIIMGLEMGHMYGGYYLSGDGRGDGWQFYDSDIIYANGDGFND